MLTAAALIALQSKPSFTDVELLPLSDLYYQHLYPNVFEFGLASGEIIILKFNLEAFCHLLGLKKTVEQARRLSREVKNEYKGMAGWNAIREGRSSKAIIRAYGVSLDPMKDKMLFFYYLPELLRVGSLAIKFVPSGSTRIPSEIIIYNLHVADNTYIQIGISKCDHGRWYYPETFLIERVKVSRPTNKFADPPSTVVSITSRNIYPRYSSPIRPKVRRAACQLPKRSNRLRKH
ncbi:PBECR4 domain-containing protein [Paenibacillus sp. FSL M7-0896]|uniref:PBECR4 domain-containing protein n=1 Tax=unclassified Paenibacillus TaxID=185978 RepID=UPI0030D72503